MADQIIYQRGAYDVRKLSSGAYEVYRHTGTHAERCAQIGYKGAKGLQRAIHEADKRHAEKESAK